MKFMRHAIAFALPAIASFTLVIAADTAQQTDPARQHGPTAVGSDVGKIVYVPPQELVGAASTRMISVPTRNGPADPPILEVLSPDPGGRTVQAQPSVFYYISKPVNSKLLLTVMKKREVNPVLEVPLNGANDGIQRLDLAKKNINLDLNVEYKISLALIVDPAHRDQDVITSGTIRRVQPTPDLLADLQKRAKPFDRALLLARSGMWYDALAILSDQIESDAKDLVSRDGRAALLDQGNLIDAAAYDRARSQTK